MKTISIRGILIVSLIIGISITGASAQQMPWGPGGGQPGFIGMAPPPPTKCKPEPCLPGNPGCAPPPCFNPYSCPPPMCKPPVTAEPSLYVGYLFKNHGAGINIDFNNGGFLGVTSVRTDFDLQGVWGELAFPVCLTQNVGGFFTMAHLFPTQPTTVERYVLVNGAARREWTPSINWWEFDWGLTYRICPYFSALGAFRWSQFIVNFNHPSGQEGLLPANEDDASLKVNAYIPLLGVLAKYDPSCTTSIKGAILGFPALPGDVEYQENISVLTGTASRFAGKGEYKSGYFLEFLAEASTSMDNWSLGAFARFDLMHTERTRDVAVEGITTQADISIDRRNWILGGKLGYMF